MPPQTAFRRYATPSEKRHWCQEEVVTVRVETATTSDGATPGPAVPGVTPPAPAPETTSAFVAPWGAGNADVTEARADRARAHEAAAEVLAARGDHRRAYHHLRAAIDLARVDEARLSAAPDQLRHEVDRLRRERAEAREQSRRDSLTATWNRRYLDERLATLRDSGHERVCVAMADVDHFKNVNDTFGHAAGDQVLRRLAPIMSEGLPPDGFCARYGGEEFALVLPATAPDEAVRLCEAARERVDRHDWEQIVPGLRVTVSVGVSCFVMSAGEGGEPVASDPTALDTVDALLYVAKRAGRNAVAYRDPRDTIRLAGPASARRGIDAAIRALFGPR